MIDWTQRILASELNIRADRAIADQERSDAMARLAETDWLVVRAIETGKPVPAEISAMRAEARAKAEKSVIETKREK